MRVDPNQYTSVNAAIQQTEQSLGTAMNQLSSGKRVSAPSDDPLAFAADVQSLAASANVDRYTRNADAVITQAQMADSALSSVVTSLTRAVSLGTEGGDGTLTTDQRAVLAQQVQGLLANVLTQANLTSNGTALFAGTASTTTPFVADTTAASGYAYQGNSDSNQAQVGDGLAVTVNIPGDSIFTSSSGNVLGSLQGMVTALQSGSTSDIADATAAVSSAISHVGQVRVLYGNTVNQLNAENDYLSQETISLTSQQQSLVSMDTATAATNLTQAQTAENAVLAMAAKVLPTSLLNYLQN
jgi:flagellar hook-associated protein 3 FlgL